MSYKLSTKKGYDFFEASSALQKSIRRGLEEEAMYWAAEFYFSNYDEYVWKRLRVITCEDIGLAEPYLMTTIHALHQNYQEIKKKRAGKGQPSERLFLTQAIFLLCRAPKSRLICHASIYHFRNHNEFTREIPDYAFDQHTKKGKAMGRGIKHFWEEGAKLENLVPQPGEDLYLERAKQTLSSPQTELFEEE